jgi:hypothetical protein
MLIERSLWIMEKEKANTNRYIGLRSHRHAGLMNDESWFYPRTNCEDHRGDIPHGIKSKISTVSCSKLFLKDVKSQHTSCNRPPLHALLAGHSCYAVAIHLPNRQCPLSVVQSVQWSQVVISQLFSSWKNLEFLFCLLHHLTFVLYLCFA